MSFVVENSPDGVTLRIYFRLFVESFVMDAKVKLLSANVKSVGSRSESNVLLRVN